MKKLFSKELLIGITVLLTLLILYFGIEYLKGINVFHSANYYYASYTNVAGLAQSAPVTVNGYKVGLVREINYEYDNPGHVRVELSLNKELKLPQGTQAVLVTDMLGTSTIELHMATSGTYHKVGDELIGVNSKGLMDNLSGEMLPNINAILPHVDSLLLAVTDIVTDPALTNSVRRLDNVMANLESATASLSVAMKNVPSITSGASSTMGNVDELTRNLAAISADLKAVSAQLGTLPIDSTYQNIHAITQNLDAITTSLNSDESSLGLLLRDPGLYNNLNNSAAHLDSILLDMQRCPKRYIPAIKIF